MVENLLKKTEIKIDTALNGPDSISLADKNKYDVILMDQRMPGMDGTEAMKSIKALDSRTNENTPIICLTADVIRGARERYLEIGFDDYLTKPVDGTELENMISEYLPKDKVQITKYIDDETSDEEETDEIFLKSLQGIGIDTNIGLKYSGNDLTMYKSILEAFSSEERTKSKNIQNSYQAKDWDNYGVYVHSLKSTSKTVGATELYEKAKELERAAKENDIATVESNHDMVMDMYADVVAVIRGCIEINNPAGDLDDEILEFMPEG